MITPSLNIAWSIAALEASAAGFDLIQPNHFWIGCCKGCDLDYAKFLQNAPPKIRNQESQIAQDFKVVRDAFAAGEANPAKLRRTLCAALGNSGEPNARPLHRHPLLRAAFTGGKIVAQKAGDSAKPVHVLFNLCHPGLFTIIASKPARSAQTPR